MRSTADVVGALASARAAGGGVIARGAGRSYGDAAQSAGGTVLDMTGLDRMLAFDGETRTVRVQAGVSYAALLAELVPRGWMLPVVPGTRHVTVGGAIASDVHGKNHPSDGTIGRHVRALTLVTPAGGPRELADTEPADRELLEATLGGMGLTGIATEATLAIEPLRAPWWSLDIDRTDSLERTLALMADGASHRFSVAWLDLLAPGARWGRGVVTRSNDWPAEHAPARRRGPDPSQLARGARARVPRGFPGWLLRPALVAAFNELRWRSYPRSDRGRPGSLPEHFFPLDGLGDWNRLYGSRGLLQYQFAVPDGAEEPLLRAVVLLRDAGVPCYLAVLKRLGPASASPLSFPLAGWTLALDIPGGADGVRPTLDRLDELVAGAGGRVYLAKDLRLRHDLLDEMYPGLARFEAQRALADPDRVLRSDLAARLGLGGVAA